MLPFRASLARRIDGVMTIASGRNVGESTTMSNVHGENFGIWSSDLFVGFVADDLDALRIIQVLEAIGVRG